MKKLLITGGSGFAGSRIVKGLQKEFELITPSHSCFDITSADDIDAAIQKIRPDIILHLAAISNTGYCQEHPEESLSVNVQGVVNIAAAAAKYGAKFVFFSSDQVYNGNHETGLLSEDVPLSPENHYGVHKLMAEQRALQVCENSVCLRATWMYDSLREGMPTHNNFVLNIMNALKNNTPLYFATREFRGITWIDDVVRNIPFTFDLPGGTYNFGAENKFNTYQTALSYADMLGGRAREIILPDENRFPEHIRNLSISMKKAYEASEGHIIFKDTVEGLMEYEKSRR